MKAVNNIFTVDLLYRSCENISPKTKFEIYSRPKEESIYSGTFSKMIEGFRNQEIDVFSIDENGTVHVILIN